jgi:hypothetical protein
MSDETHGEKISRIDANVKLLLSSFSTLRDLEKDSAVNKREHKIFTALLVAVIPPSLLWFWKKLLITII